MKALVTIFLIITLFSCSKKKNSSGGGAPVEQTSQANNTDGSVEQAPEEIVEYKGEPAALPDNRAGLEIVNVEYIPNMKECSALNAPLRFNNALLKSFQFLSLQELVIDNRIEGHEILVKMDAEDEDLLILKVQDFYSPEVSGADFAENCEFVSGRLMRPLDKMNRLRMLTARSQCMGKTHDYEVIYSDQAIYAISILNGAQKPRTCIDSVFRFQSDMNTDAINFQDL
jgi:hypothetical protein